MILVMVATNDARAQIETLVMPGELIAGHAELEATCGNCHKAFDRGRQRELCLDCHDDVRSDLADTLGYHGRDPEVASATCASCHTDHEGRDADIVALDINRCNHDLTDFALLGAHEEAECTGCHTDGEKYRNAPGDCLSCHEAENPHGSTMGEACGDCHTTVEWTDVEFDHDTTGYSLVGLHQDVACLDCHEDQTFLGAQTTCYDCHASDDVHNGLSGNGCDNCHSPFGWDDTRFDHERDTSFPLHGGHAEVACDGCHSDEPFSDNLSVECIGCHLDDDEHDGHNGKQCETCHDDVDWATIHFDHAVDAHYPLLGAHEDAECVGCHIEPIFLVALQQDCVACHETDDVHEGSQGIVCNDCHNESAWDQDVFFDHGLTAFPLLGKHDEVECDDCHESHVFTDAPSACIDCHAEDDSHDGRFGEDCALCHNPVDWDRWIFDHNRQTDFELSGAHVDVACEGCHRTSLDSQEGLGDSCISCHRGDDVHDGEFGSDCGRCHSARSFSEVRSIQ